MGSHASSERARGDVERVMDALRRLVRMLRVSSKRAETSTGLSGARLFVLEKLSQVGPCSIVDLARETTTDASSVSVVVAALVAQGLAARGRSEKDARRAEIAITRRGRAALARPPKTAQAAWIEALTAMSPARRRGLARALEGFVRDVGAEAITPTMLLEDGPPKRASTRRRRS